MNVTNRVVYKIRLERSMSTRRMRIGAKKTRRGYGQDGGKKVLQRAYS